MFDINTEKGKSYTATADVYIAVPDGVVPSGAFFDIKSISQNGSQVTIPGGKSVEEMKDSIEKWSKQSISFVAVDNKTSLGLIKWDENSNSESTINTNVYLDNLKVTDNTKYKIVWQDNFSGKVLDQNVWGYELGNIRGNEQEHYSSSSDNISLKDGNLVLKVTDRPKEDQYRNTERLGNNARLVKYNSGSVRTHGKKEFLYGRIEAKAKLPKGKGVFPAFWTLGADFPIDGRMIVNKDMVGRLLGKLILWNWLVHRQMNEQRWVNKAITVIVIVSHMVLHIFIIQNQKMVIKMELMLQHVLEEI